MVGSYVMKEGGRNRVETGRASKYGTPLTRQGRGGGGAIDTGVGTIQHQLHDSPTKQVGCRMMEVCLPPIPPPASLHKPAFHWKIDTETNVTQGAAYIDVSTPTIVRDG